MTTFSIPTLQCQPGEMYEKDHHIFLHDIANTIDWLQKEFFPNAGYDSCCILHHGETFCFVKKKCRYNLHHSPVHLRENVP
jgi:hypothetical protein